jgi:hypothetical protein
MHSPVRKRFKEFRAKKKGMLKFLFTFAVAMNQSAKIKTNVLRRNLVTALCIGVSLAAFATLGDGGKKHISSIGNDNLLSLRSAPLDYKHFSLKSGYEYRGNSILNTETRGKFIFLNTVMTYQKGNATYILPLKKKLFLGKVTFTPSASQR